MYRRVCFTVDDAPPTPVYLDEEQIKAVSAVINAFVKENVKFTNSFNLLVSSLTPREEDYESSKKKGRRRKGKYKKKHYRETYVNSDVRDTNAPIDECNEEK